jgi:hypothetical protein
MDHGGASHHAGHHHSGHHHGQSQLPEFDAPENNDRMFRKRFLTFFIGGLVVLALFLTIAR